MHLGNEGGVAVVVALLAALLLAALGTALLLTTSTETRIAANFLNGAEARYAAGGIAERALADLLPAPNWKGWLDGSARSAFADGQPAGIRTLADGAVIDVSQVVSLANCGKSTACTGADMDARTVERPWGPNNPRWQPYAYGHLRDIDGVGRVHSGFYVIAMLADDASENDGNPIEDGTTAGNPGSGVIALRAEAFGPRGAHKTLEVTIARRVAGALGLPLPVVGGGMGVRVLSWREIE